METLKTTSPARERATATSMPRKGAAWRRAEFVHRLILLSGMPAGGAVAPPPSVVLADRQHPELRPRADIPSA